MTNKLSTKKWSASYVYLNMILTGLVLISAKLTEYALPFCATLSQKWFGVSVYVTVAALLFPAVYCLSSIFSEVYGYHSSRMNAMINYILNLIMVILVAISDGSFTAGSNGRVLAGSLIGGFCSVMICDLLGDTIFQKIRDKQNGNSKTFWIRAAASAVIADACDGILFTILFQKIAFGTPWSVIWITCLFYIPLKTIPKLVMVPIASVISKKLRKIEGEEAFEPRSCCNWLGLYTKEYKTKLAANQ